MSCITVKKITIHQCELYSYCQKDHSLSVWAVSIVTDHCSSVWAVSKVTDKRITVYQCELHSCCQKDDYSSMWAVQLLPKASLFISVSCILSKGSLFTSVSCIVTVKKITLHQCELYSYCQRIIIYQCELYSYCEKDHCLSVWAVQLLWKRSLFISVSCTVTVNKITVY